jgi:hypothetical protein
LLPQQPSLQHSAPRHDPRASSHSSPCTKTRCSSAQTMKYGPGRHLQSSSRCQRASTRCTGEPHSWQGGEARAIRSALFMASEGRSQSRAAVRCASLRTSRRSTRSERPAGRGRSRNLRTARYCSVEHRAARARARRTSAAWASDRQPRPRRSLCVRSPLALSPIESTLSYRHSAQLGVIDRAPIPVSAGRRTPMAEVHG